MHIECTRHVDASELDEAGFYEYCYEYDLYRFTDESICFVARSYTDEPNEVHFLRVEEDGRPRLMVNADLTHPVCLAAQAHLLAVGKSIFAGLVAGTAMGLYRRTRAVRLNFRRQIL